MPAPAGEPTPLLDGQELLFRQIHPTFLQNGQPTSQAFAPTPKDQGCLSLDRSSVFTAAQSFHHYTVINGLRSQAVFGLTVSELAAEAITCFDDPIPRSSVSAGNPAHCVADFRSHPPGAHKTIAKRLKIAAVRRGLLHP